MPLRVEELQNDRRRGGDVQGVYARGHRDAHRVIDVFECRFAQPSALGPEQECNARPWIDRRSKSGKRNSILGEIEGDQLIAGTTQLLERLWPEVESRKRNLQRASHRNADRLAVERVAGAWAQENAIRAKCHCVAKHGPDILGIRQAFQNDEQRSTRRRSRNEFERPHCFADPARGETTSMHVETHDLIEQILLCDVDGCALREQVQYRAHGFARPGSQEQRICAISRIAHEPLDHEPTLGHEETSASPKIGITQIAVVCKARIVESFDPDHLHREIEAQGAKAPPPSDGGRTAARKSQRSHFTCATFQLLTRSSGAGAGASRLPRLTSIRVAVTGATGLLGGYLIRGLLQRGARPIAVVRNPRLAEPLGSLGVEVRSADLADVRALARAFTGVDCVIANAALVSLKPHPFSRYLDVNVEGTIHVFEAMRIAGIQRAIQISTVGIYRGHHAPADEDHPRYGEGHKTHRLNGYKVSKALAEETAWRYASKYEIALTSLRPSVLYGAFDRNFGVWHKGALRLRPFAPYPYFARFCLVYAGDVAEAAMLSLENPTAAGRAYNVTGEDLRLWDFAEAWIAQDSACQSRRLPLPIVYRRDYTSERIKRDLGWTARSYGEGIRETLALERA